MNIYSLPQDSYRSFFQSKGFTLLELLVVISIIVLLTTLAITSVKHARAKARDTKRVSDFSQIQKALELFYDTYNLYPCGDSFGSSKTNYIDGTADSAWSAGFLNGCCCSPTNCPDCKCVQCSSCNKCIVDPKYGLVDEGLLQDGLKNPINESPTYGYRIEVASDRQEYILYTHLETNAELMRSDSGLCDDLYEVGPGVGKVQPRTDMGPVGCPNS